MSEALTPAKAFLTSTRPAGGLEGMGSVASLVASWKLLDSLQAAQQQSAPCCWLR